MKESTLDLKFTGERAVPGKTPDRIMDGVIARYLLAVDWLNGCSNVLDVGCGTGIGVAFLSKQKFLAYGIDVDYDALAYGKQYPFGDIIQSVRCSGEMICFPDSCFDVVIAFESMEHMDTPQAFVKEVHRVLKPNGFFLCSVPHCIYDVLNEMLYNNTNPFHIQRFSFYSMRHLLGHYFNIEKEYVQGIHTIYHPLKILLRFILRQTILKNPLLRDTLYNLREMYRNLYSKIPRKISWQQQTNFISWNKDSIYDKDKIRLYVQTLGVFPETMIFAARKK